MPHVSRPTKVLLLVVVAALVARPLVEKILLHATSTVVRREVPRR